MTKYRGITLTIQLNRKMAPDESEKTLNSEMELSQSFIDLRNKTNDLILNLTPENVTQYSGWSDNFTQRKLNTH